MSYNLKNRKTDALKCMLNFNTPVTKVINFEKLWKILICDRHGLDIISTLFTPKGLRDLGVTLTLNINSEREALPDVPCIYFVLPTTENIAKICKDIDGGMYENYYINFISPINREKLEHLAHSTYQSESVSQISKIFDQYTNFICLEDDLFVLHDDKTEIMSYSNLNGAGKTDKEIDTIINAIVDGLFSVCVTMGTVPIIRCPQGNAAELVAEKLDKKLKDNLRDTRNTLFNGMNSLSMQSSAAHTQLSFERPLLVILDRNMDLATPIHHPWTYQALVNEILTLKNNSVYVPSQTKKPTQYDLWCDNDEVWRDERHKPLPEIAGVIHQSLETIKAKEKEMTQLKATMGFSGDDDANNFAENTNKLSNTVSSLKNFLEKKKLLEVHTNIATYLVDQIKHRKLDIYFELGEKLRAKQPLQEKSLLDMLSDPDGKPRDMLRLLLLAILYGGGSPANSLKDITDQELDQLCSLIQMADDEVSVMAAVRYVRLYRKHTQHNIFSRQSTKPGGLFTKFINQGQAMLMEGVRNLVVKKHKLPFTRIVNHLMEQNSDNEVANFKYYDPKLYRSTEGGNLPRQKSPFQEAIVFVVGGGNYIEYQNLIEYCKTNPNERPKKISYGCTELLNGEQFLSQLSTLGKNV